MIDLLTPESIASEIKLLREDAKFKGPVLLVEGETDANFFSNFLIQGELLIRWLKGKSKTLKIAEILEKDKCEGIVAIVDADFWHIRGIPTLGSNVFITDVHDLDMMIFSSFAFDKVFREFFSARSLDAFAKKYGNMKTALLESVRSLGILRLINEQQGLGIDFQKLDESATAIYWADLFIVSDLRFEFDDVLASLCKSNHPLRRHIKQHLASVNMNDFDLFMLCNGHDVMQVACKLIKSQGRSEVKNRVEHNDIERSFRLAYEMQFFKKTQLYEKLINWQNSTGYKLLD
jgi:hypothetical protein